MVALNKTYLKALTPDRSAKDSGHRFYSPEISRWLSRDPIEEEGGANAYAFCANAPQSFVDPLGLRVFLLLREAFQEANLPWYVVPDNAIHTALLIDYADGCDGRRAAIFETSPTDDPSAFYWCPPPLGVALVSVGYPYEIVAGGGVTTLPDIGGIQGFPEPVGGIASWNPGIQYTATQISDYASLLAALVGWNPAAIFVVDATDDNDQAYINAAMSTPQGVWAVYGQNCAEWCLNVIDSVPGGTWPIQNAINMGANPGNANAPGAVPPQVMSGFPEAYQCILLGGALTSPPMSIGPSQ